ncbi:MAG TPA: hypothetical protein VGE59_01145 [Patescibacteria group bacterium]
MDSISLLPSPLNTIVIENKRGEYKDFGLDANDPYPLKGVTYPVDYGYIPGYMGEDDAELDFFVGSDREGLSGSITVSRGKGNPDEHKFYIALTPEEREAILKEFAPVLLQHTPIESKEQLTEAISDFKTTNA